MGSSRKLFISLNYRQQRLLEYQQATGLGTAAPPPPPLLTTGVQGKDIYDSGSDNLAVLFSFLFFFPVPTIEDFSVSPPMPKTTAALSNPPTAKGPADSTMAGADPRDGRDPFEGSRGSGTARPAFPELPPTPRRFCEATRRRAIDWPQTYTGIAVDRPCPKGTRGRTFRTPPS